MLWLDLGLLSAIHGKIAITLLGTIALYGSLTTSDRVPQRQRALARVRKVNRPTVE